MAIFDDLGSMIGGAPEAIAPTWKSLVDSPEKQAALMSFGLQLMAGGHGDQFQRLAVAGGHGMEAASATEAANRQQQEKTAAIARGEQEKAADRASREKVAQIGADSRMDVAQTRVAGMLERAAMIRQPKNDAEIKFFNDQLGKVSKDLERDIIGGLKIGGAERDQLIRARALERLEEARSRGIFPNSGGGGPSPLGGPESGLSSQNSPGAGGTKSQGGRQGSAQPADGAKPPANGPTWEQYSARPDIQEALKDPAFREQLAAKRPDWRKYLEFGPGANEKAWTFEGTPLMQGVEDFYNRFGKGYKPTIQR